MNESCKEAQRDLPAEDESSSGEGIQRANAMDIM